MHSSVILSIIHTYYCATITTIHPQNSSSCKTETLYPLNNNPYYSPNPQATTILLSVSMNLTTLGPHISGDIQYLSFRDSLISLSIMSSKFIHVVACVRILSIFKAKSYSIVGIYCVFFIHSFVDGLLGCLHLFWLL